MLKTWLSHKELEQNQETLRFIYLALSQATESKIKKHWYLSTWLCHKQLEQNQEKLKADVLSRWHCRNVHELHLDTRYLLAQY